MNEVVVCPNCKKEVQLDTVAGGAAGVLYRCRNCWSLYEEKALPKMRELRGKLQKLRQAEEAIYATASEN